MNSPATRGTIEEIAARTEERIVAQLEKRLADALTEQEERHRAQITELQTALRIATATVTTMLERLTAAEQTAATPPPKLAKACSPAPGDRHLRRVEVDIAGRTVTQYVPPGSDPDEVWDGIRCDVIDMPEQAWQR